MCKLVCCPCWGVNKREVCVEGEENKRGRKQRKAGGRVGIRLGILGPGEVGEIHAGIYPGNQCDGTVNCMYCGGVAMQKKQCETS